MMAKDPTQRHQTPTEVIQQLTPFVEIRVEWKGKQHQISAPRLRLLPWGAAAGIVAASLVSGVLLYLSSIHKGEVARPTPLVTTSSKAPDPRDWVSLLKGKDLEGWEAKEADSWEVGPEGVLMNRGGGALLATIRDNYTNFTLRGELSGSREVEAFIGMRLQRNANQQWRGPTSGVFGEGDSVRVGMLGEHFLTTEWGIGRLDFAPGQRFTWQANVGIADGVWIDVNRQTTAGVRLRPHFTSGRIVLFVRKGTLTVHKLELKEGMPVRE
jgi:hypothetical protein